MALAEFGAPIMDSLKPYLSGPSGFISDLGERASALGQTIASGINFIGAAFSNGAIWDLARLGLQLAFQNSVNFLVRLLTAGFAVVVQSVGEHFKNLVAILAVATKPEFWSGLGLTLLGLAAQFGNKLLEFVANLVGAMDFLPGVGKKFAEAASGIRSFAQSSGEDVRTVTGACMDLLREPLALLASRQAESQAALGAAFTEAMQDTPEILAFNGAALG